MTHRVAFIGLGVMGSPIARHLARAGHELSVFNRTTARAEDWVERHGGRLARSPEEAAEQADFVVCCVGNDEHLTQVLFSTDGALAGMKSGSVLIDHTTASAQLAREIYRACTARGIGALDAPVSGGQAGAESGTLTVMVGGSEHDYERARPLLGSYSRYNRLLGPAGSGQLAKMVNQICIAGTLQGLAEGLHFGETAGLELSAVVEVLAHGAAQSWQMDNRAQSMIDGRFDFGFAVDWMRKDLGLALAEARANGAAIPLAALVDQFYSDVQARGGGRWDTSSLIERLRARRSN